MNEKELEIEELKSEVIELQNKLDWCKHEYYSALDMIEELNMIIERLGGN